MPTRVRLDQFNPANGLDRGRGRLVEMAWYLVKMFFFLSAFPWPSRLKSALLRLFGASVGKGCVIKPRVNIHLPWKLVLGDHCWIGEEAYLLNLEPIVVGSHVCISQRAFLCTGNHDYRDPAFAYRNAAISVGDGAWIGAASFVGPGASVGQETVVTAGAIVSGNLAPGMVYTQVAGVLTARAARWKQGAPT